MAFQYIYQQSTSVESVWLDTKRNTLKVTFKKSDWVYRYDINPSYTTVISEMLSNSKSLGKTVNFIIRNESAVTMVSKTPKESIVTIQS